MRRKTAQRIRFTPEKFQTMEEKTGEERSLSPVFPHHQVQQNTFKHNFLTTERSPTQSHNGLFLLQILK